MRPRPNFKLIVGREEGENNFLEGYRKLFTHLRTVSHLGPLALIDGEINDDDMLLAAQLVARYSQGRDADSVRVSITPRDGAGTEIDVRPMADSAIPGDWHL